jgi:multiple sugar transport system substrate-binding protein
MTDRPIRSNWKRRLLKLAARGSALALVGSAMVACSGSDDGITINLYGGASAAGFDKIISDCNK